MRTEDAGPRNASKTKLHGFVARSAPTAVVLRRGPSRHTQMLRWNLRDDRVEPGQWLVGTVEHAACGLSPSGELLVYSARKGGSRFTAVSRPPYFTALAFWEERLPWTGGGFFADDAHLVLGVTHAPDEGSLPRGLTVTEVWSYCAWQGNGRSSATFGDAVLAAPEAHQGWSRYGRRWEKPNPARALLRLVREGALGRPGSYLLARGASANAATVGLGPLDWADWAPDGSLLLGREGRLLRQRVPEAIGEKAPPPALVADLTRHAFERVLAPKDARRWPRGLTA